MLAVVTGAHGIGGEVRLKLFAERFADFVRFNDGALTRTAFRAQPGGGIARFVGVADRTAAEALRGTLLSVPRDALPPLGEGEYYHADLLGLAAVTAAGEAVGTVVGVENFGAGDVVEIERAGGGRAMLPLRAPAVAEWDDARMVVDPDWLV